MKEKGEESRNRVSLEEKAKPSTTAGEASEHVIVDKQTNLLMSCITTSVPTN